jgi:hypothetical protein
MIRTLHNCQAGSAVALGLLLAIRIQLNYVYL